MSRLASIKIRGLRQLGRLDVDLGSGESLVLIGPNASGKSTFLDELAKELDADLEGRVHPSQTVERGPGGDRDLRIAFLGRPIQMRFSEAPGEALDNDRFIALTLLDDRRARLPVEPFDTLPKSPRARVGGSLPSLLGARWARKRIATEEFEAQIHEAWFLGVRQTLRALLGEPDLRLAIGAEECALDLGDGRRPTFDQLSRGQSAAIALWSEIFVRVEAARERTGDPTLDPHGVVIVDGVETDLDVRLQRELLPTLAARFPNVQWIVSTHSPLSAMSLDGAQVLDLARRETKRGASLREEGIEALIARMIGLPPRPPGSRPPRAKSVPPPGVLPPDPRRVSPPSRPAPPKGSRPPPPPPGAGRPRSAPPPNRRGTSVPPPPPPRALRSSRPPPPPKSPPTSRPPPPGSLPERTRRTTMPGSGWNGENE